MTDNTEFSQKNPKVILQVDSLIFIKSDHDHYKDLVAQYGEDTVYVLIPDNEVSQFRADLINVTFNVPEDKIIVSNNVEEVAKQYENSVVILAANGIRDILDSFGYVPGTNELPSYVKIDESAELYNFNTNGAYTIYVKEIETNKHAHIVAESEIVASFTKKTFNERFEVVSKHFPILKNTFGEKREAIFEAINGAYRPVKKLNIDIANTLINKTLTRDSDQLNESLNDPYEVDTFSFLDLKNLIDDLSSGKIVDLYEKLGGLKLKVSFKNGAAIFARNVDQMKDLGKNSISLAQMKEMFVGHGEIQQTLYAAAEELSTSFAKTQHLNEIFENGKCWASLSIIAPKVAKVASYGKNFISVNTISDYSERSKISKPQLVPKLMEALRMSKTEVGTRFTIRSTDENKLTINTNVLSQLDFTFEKQLLSSFVTDNKLTMESTINDMMTSVFLNKLSDLEAITHTKISEENKDNLILRFANDDADTRLTPILDSISSTMLQQKLKELDLEVPAIHKKHMAAIDLIFLRVGAKFISALNGFLAEDVTGEVLDNIKARIKNMDIDKLDDDSKDTLSTEMEKLDAITKAAKIYPTEGVVFLYKGAKIKLVGAFSPITKILQLDEK